MLVTTPAAGAFVEICAGIAGAGLVATGAAMVLGATVDAGTSLPVTEEGAGGVIGIGAMVAVSLAGGSEDEEPLNCHHATEPSNTTPPMAAIIGNNGERRPGSPMDDAPLSSP